MRLRSRALERRVWKTARRKLRSSKTLWREYRRSRRKRQSVVANVLVVVGLSCGLLLGILSSVGWSDGVLIALTFLLTSLAIGGGAALYNGLYTSFDVYVCSHLPVPGDRFFDLQLRSLVKWSGYAVLVAFIVLSFGAGHAKVGPVQMGITACLTLLHGAVAMAVAMAVVMWTGPGTRKTLMLLTFLIAGCLTVMSAGSKEPIAGAWELSFVVPAGWVNFAFRQAVMKGQIHDLLWALPALAAVHFTVWARHSMRSTFVLGELAFSMGVTAEQVRDRMAEISPELAEVQRVDRIQLLGAAPWLTGVMDRMIRRLMTPRERHVLDLVSADQPFTWGRWKTGAILVSVMTAITLLGSPPEWLITVMFIAGALIAMPVLGGTWPGLELVQWGTVQGPLYAMYPIGYWELSRVIMKTNLVQILLWAPFLVIGCAAGAPVFELARVDGLKIGVSALLAVLAIRPLVVGMKLRSQLFDSNRITVRGLFNAVAMLCWIGVVVTIGAVAAGTGDLVGWAVGLAGLFAVSVACWGSCAVVYNRWRVDVLSTIKEQP